VTWVPPKAFIVTGILFGLVLPTVVITSLVDEVPGLQKLRRIAAVRTQVYPSNSAIASPVARSSTGNRRRPQPRPTSLLRFQEVADRLRLASRSYLGIRTIPLSRIIGSVDRACEFDRDFHPLRRDSQTRLSKLRLAFPDGDLPAISVFEVGGAYFVSDGHHRVALAHEQGQSFIEAEIVRLETTHQLSPDVDIPQLIHVELRRELMEESGLQQVRPDIDLTFSNPAGYIELLEAIKAHGWDLAVRLGRLPEPAEMAQSWLTSTYDPSMRAIRRDALDLDAAETTEGDVFLWLYQRRRTLCASGGACGFGPAAQDALNGRGLPRQLRNALRRQVRAIPSRPVDRALVG
jgi:hypothetical protein